MLNLFQHLRGLRSIEETLKQVQGDVNELRERHDAVTIAIGFVSASLRIRISVSVKIKNHDHAQF